MILSLKIDCIRYVICLFILFGSDVCGKIIPKKLDTDFYTLPLLMPGISPQKNDQYFCTATNVSAEEFYIKRFEPNADTNKIHHILIFGCKNIRSSSHLYPNYWSCSQANICLGMKIIYAWGRNAPNLALPKEVGFHVGQRSDVNFLILQAHYAKPFAEKDSSGVNLVYTLLPQPFVAGIFLLASFNGVIPPNEPKSHVDVNCALKRNTINVFAYRVHAHSLGTVITGYKYSHSNKQWTMLVKGNPQWPQAFYPMQTIVKINSDDILAARCTYNSTQRSILTKIGSTAGAEMCNLYLMYYEENPLLTVVSKEDLINSRVSGDGGGAFDALSMQNYFFKRTNKNVCQDVEVESLMRFLPPGNDVPLPRNITMEESAKGQHNNHHVQHQSNIFKHLSSSSIIKGFRSSDSEESSGVFDSNDVIRIVQNSNWPYGTNVFGQITAVDVDSDQNIVIFHRGRHVWNARSFDFTNRYMLIEDGPISEPPIVKLDPLTKQIIHQWGSGLFYMPHGLTINHKNKTVWLTDVALHQVFQFSIDPNSAQYRKPIVTLGERFVPGNDDKHFCKPTSVAIDFTNGDFYVADGYCNSRVIRFNSDAIYQTHWGHAPIWNDADSNLFPIAPNILNIPHKVVLIDFNKDEKVACVADRENGRIQCFLAPYGQFKFQIKRNEFNGRLFSIAYSKVNRILYAVCGPSLHDPSRKVMGFAFNIDSQEMIAIFTPNSGTFSQPHDIAVSDSGNIYVVEIGPNNIWMFSRVDQSSSDKTSGENEENSSTGDNSEVSGNGVVMVSVVDKTNGAIVSANTVSQTKSVIKSKIIESNLNGHDHGMINGDGGHTKPNHINIAFELLRIRSKQFRDSVSLNNMLYFVMFALFLFIIVLHLRHSSPYYSPITFVSNLCHFIIACVCGRRSKFTNLVSKSNTNGTSVGGGASEKIDLGNLFGDRRERKMKKHGFNRLPQNEEESEMQLQHSDEDDDDDEDDGDLSDIIEDFNISKTIRSNQRMI